LTRLSDTDRQKKRVDLGKRLMLMRARVDLSQAQVAEALGVRRPTVTAWENGDAEPKALDLQHLADLFGVDINVLTGRATLPLE